LSWHCFPPFDSSPNGEPLIGERIRQVADFPPLEAGGWKLTALFNLKEVGEHFGLHDAQVSRIARRGKSAESNARP
jgi:hypothetical protein